MWVGLDEACHFLWAGLDEPCYFLLCRLDVGERNNGHIVTGYLVSLNGQLVTRATSAVSCQVELDHLEPDSDYMVTVRWAGLRALTAPRCTRQTCRLDLVWGQSPHCTSAHSPTSQGVA